MILRLWVSINNTRLVLCAGAVNVLHSKSCSLPRFTYRFRDCAMLMLLPHAARTHARWLGTAAQMTQTPLASAMHPSLHPVSAKTASAGTPALTCVLQVGLQTEGCTGDCMHCQWCHREHSSSSCHLADGAGPAWTGCSMHASTCAWHAMQCIVCIWWLLPSSCIQGAYLQAAACAAVDLLLRFWQTCDKYCL
jgi:hypothetical protein